MHIVSGSKAVNTFRSFTTIGVNFENNTDIDSVSGFNFEDHFGTFIFVGINFVHQFGTFIFLTLVLNIPFIFKS